MLFDTHAHLNLEPFQEGEIASLIENASQKDVNYILNVGIDESSNQKAINIATNHPNCFASIGIHPHEAQKYQGSPYLESINTLAKDPQVKAIGEIGLDFHYNHSTPKHQKEVFAYLLNTAKSLNLPAIIHNREATKETLEILKSSQHTKFVFHCFGDNYEVAKNILDLGGLISITGIVTFKNAITLKETLKEIPLDKLMLETDCPFLAPVPYRGKRNEPSYLKEIAQTVAEIKNVSYEQICHSTTQTAKEFFNV
jgi:TatD DNase family protein